MGTPVEQFLSSGFAPTPSTDTGFGRWAAGDDQRDALSRSIKQGQSVPPDRAARVLRLQMRTGYPEGLIDRNLDSLEAEASKNTFDPAQFQKSSPLMAQWVSESPNHAALAHPELGWWARLERAVTSGGRVVGLQREQTELTLKEMGGETLTPADRKRMADLNRQIAESSDSRDDDAAIGTARDFSNMAVQQGYQLALMAEGGLKGGAAGAAAGSILPGIGTTAGYVAGGSAGILTNLAVDTYKQEAAGAYQQFRDIKDLDGQPIDQQSAVWSARAVGVINSAIELGSEALLAKLLPGVSNVLGTMTKPGVQRAVQQALRAPTTRAAVLEAAKKMIEVPSVEAAEEFVQSFVTSGGREVAQATSGQTFAPDKFAEDLGSAANQAFHAFRGMIGLGLVTHAIPTYLHDAPRVQEAERNKSFFTALGTGMKDSKLFQAMPEMAQSLVDRMTKNGPHEFLYVDAPVWQEYWQSKNVDPAAMASEVIGISADEYEQAMRSGEQLQIPTARYATTIAPSEHNSHFANELRFSPLEWNAREAKEALKRLDAEEAARPDTPAENAAPSTETLEPIAADIHRQLMETGRVPENVSRTQSTIVGRMFSRLGERLGMDPMALYRRYNPSIQSAEDPRLGARQSVDAAALAERQAMVAQPGTPEFYRGSTATRDWNAKGEDGLFHFARSAGKNNPLRSNLEQVRTEGLVAELANMYDANAQENTAPTVLDSDVAGEKYVGAKPAAMKASGRILQRAKGIKRIEAELERRGVNHDAKVAEWMANLESSDTEFNPAEFDQSGARPAAPFPDQVHVINADASRGGVQEAAAAHPESRDAARNAARTYAREHIQGHSFVNLHTGLSIEVSGEGIKHGWSSERSLAQAVALAHLDVLIPNAVHFSDDAPRPGSAPELIAMHRFYAPMRIGDREYLVRLFAKEMRAGKDRVRRIQYDHLTVENEKPSAGIVTGSASPATETLRTPAFSGRPSTVTIDDFLRDVNAARDAHEFFQRREEEPARGRIRIGPNREMSIDLFANADRSTFLHESAHMFLEVLRDVAPENPALQTDLDTLLKWFGVDSADQIEPKHHEQFARGLEAYFMEGRAPSIGLRRVFASVKSWMLGIYRTLKSLNVSLNPDVRSVFDRLLASDEEITRAQETLDAKPLFSDPEALGMSADEVARYSTAVTDAREQAESTLAGKMLEDVARQDRQRYQDERDAVRDDVAQEINQRPEYIALAALQKGTLPDGSPLPEGLPVKLSKGSILQTYGKEMLDRLPRPLVFAAKGGMHPDQAAGLFGFSSGDELLEALANAPDRTGVIEATTDDRMRQRYGDMLTDEGRRTEAAIAAVHSEKRAELLRKELEILASDHLAAFKGMVRRISMRVPSNATLRDRAVETIATKVVRTLNLGVYQRAETSAAAAARDALLKGDIETAFQEKLRELWNHELYRAASEAKDEIADTERYMSRFEKRRVRQDIGKAGNDYLEQIDLIRARFKFADNVTFDTVRRPKTLPEWAAEQRALGIPMPVPDVVVDERLQKDYRELSVENVRDVRSAVQTIEHLAKQENELLAQEKAKKIDDATAEMTSQIAANHDLTPAPLDFAPGLKSRMKDWTRAGVAAHTRMEFLFDDLDGGVANGPVWRYMYKPFADADGNRDTLANRSTEVLADIFGAYTRKERGEWYSSKKFYPLLRASLTKANVLALALNWGNEYNRQAVVEGFAGWTRENVQHVLESTLTEKDWKTVQAIWDHLETFWPAVSQLEKDLTGLSPEKVQASSVTTPNGVLRGGYYPVAFDANRSSEQFAIDTAQAAQDVLGGYHGQVMTRHGHTKARTYSAGKPIALNLSVLTGHISNVIHDLAFRKPVIDAAKLIERPEFRDAVERARGKEYYRQLRPWLVSIANDRVSETAGHVESLLSHLRTGGTVVGLGYKLTSALMQTLGYLNTANVIGTEYSLRGMRDALKNPIRLGRTWRFIAERSTEMRGRRQNFDRDVRDAMRKFNAIDQPSGKLAALSPYMVNLHKSFFYFTGYMDLATSVPTWLGAYAKAMDGKVEGVDAGAEPDAIGYADKVVRLTQSAGAPKDLAGVQRGGEAWRLFTMFYSQLSLQFNLYTRALDQQHRANVAGKGVRNLPKLTAAAVALWFLPAVLEETIRGHGPDPDKDQDWLSWLTRKAATYPFGTIVLVRDLVNAIERAYDTGHVDFTMSPAVDVGQSVAQTIYSGRKIFSDEEFTRHEAKTAANATGYLLKLPSRQVWQTLEYFHDWMTEQSEPESAANAFWHAFVTGKPK